MSIGEAVHPFIGVHVDDLVMGEMSEYRLVLVDPLGIEVGHKELNLSIVPVGGNKQGDQHIIEVME